MNNLGYTFKNPDLYKRALTHSSLSSQNYERLEFLGDSLLDFVVGDYFFKAAKDLDEGRLTVLRAHFVSESNLSKVFDQLGIEKEVNLGKSFQGPISKAIKCDIVEAIVAAIYLDGGLDRARAFIESKLDLKDYGKVIDDNYKSRLQELIQSSFKCKMQYVTEKDGQQFKSTFFMDEDEIESGWGDTKLEAEQQAAKKSIAKLFKNY